MCATNNGLTFETNKDSLPPKDKELEPGFQVENEALTHCACCEAKYAFPLLLARRVRPLPQIALLLFPFILKKRSALRLLPLSP